VRASDFDRDFARSRTLLEEAIALDSGFAMAWRKLGIQLGNEGDRAGAVRALTAAYRHRERLAGTERTWTEASYFGTVTYEDSRAIQAYRSIIEADSLDSRAMNNLALILVRSGRLKAADSILLQSARIDSTRASPLTNRVEVLIALNELDRADSLMNVVKRQFRYDVAIGLIELELRYRQEGVAGAERILPLILATSPEDPRVRGLVAEVRGNMAAIRGAVREAFRHYQTARREALRSGDLRSYYNVLFNHGFIQTVILRNPDQSITMMEEELRDHPFTALDEVERPYLGYGYNYAMAGQFSRARAMLAQFEQLPPDLKRRDEPFRLSVRAMIALGEGDFDQAMDFLDQNTRKDDCPSCVRAERGLIWDRSGNADSAIAEYEGFLSQPDISRPWSDQYFLPGILHRLGQLHDDKGSREKALDYYGRFVDLWKDADRELQPRVAEARQRIAALTAE
jgi:tetratricopeptide (TPR) repeat protein